MRMGTDSDFRIRTQKYYARMRREPGSGPVKKFIKTRNCIIPDPNVIRIRELNEKNNANGSGFSFPNPDSRILCPSKTQTRIRILGSGPPSKNSSKSEMRIIPDPDVIRIHYNLTKNNRNGIRIRFPKSGLKNFYANSEFA
jgi:hypothetical protein